MVVPWERSQARVAFYAVLTPCLKMASGLEVASCYLAVAPYQIEASCRMVTSFCPVALSCCLVVASYDLAATSCCQATVSCWTMVSCCLAVVSFQVSASGRVAASS